MLVENRNKRASVNPFLSDEKLRPDGVPVPWTPRWLDAHPTGFKAGLRGRAAPDAGINIARPFGAGYFPVFGHGRSNPLANGNMHRLDEVVERSLPLRDPSHDVDFFRLGQ